MSFSLYCRQGDRLTQVAPLKLTGPDGVLATFLHAHAEAETPFGWQFSDTALIARVRPDLDPQTHLIVLDLLPESFCEVCLYHVTHIQGVSEFDESDVVLASRILYQGKVNEPAQTFKMAFTCDQPEGTRQMMEALRLTGGVTRPPRRCPCAASPRSSGPSRPRRSGAGPPSSAACLRAGRR